MQPRGGQTVAGAVQTVPEIRVEAGVLSEPVHWPFQLSSSCEALTCVLIVPSPFMFSP